MKNMEEIFSNAIDAVKQKDYPNLNNIASMIDKKGAIKLANEFLEDRKDYYSIVKQALIDNTREKNNRIGGMLAGTGLGGYFGYRTGSATKEAFKNEGSKVSWALSIAGGAVMGILGGAIGFTAGYFYTDIAQKGFGITGKALVPYDEMTEKDLYGFFKDYIRKELKVVLAISHIEASELELNFEDSITNRRYDKPVVALDGNTYELDSLVNWYYGQGRRTCPLDPSKELTDPYLLPTNNALKRIMGDYDAQKLEHGRRTIELMSEEERQNNKMIGRFLDSHEHESIVNNYIGYCINGHQERLQRQSNDNKNSKAV